MEVLRRVSAVLALIGLTIALMGGALAANSGDAERRIDDLLSSRGQPGNPGLAASVIQSGKIIYSKGFGTAQLEYGVPISPNTVFDVASVSKQMTGMAITLLVIDGKVNLDDPVQDYLSWLPRYEQEVTVRSLLHHTSGLREAMDLFELAGRQWHGVSRSAALDMIAAQKELNATPGEAYHYNNTGYMLLAEIVSTVSGMSFAQFCDERIFEPLGMKQTAFIDDTTSIVPNRAVSYEQGDNNGWLQILPYSEVVGETGLYTTVEDFALWLDNFRHGKVGGREAIDLMVTPSVLNSGETSYYGHGVGVGKLGDVDVVVHNGATQAFRAYSIWYPQQELGISIFSNSGSSSPATLGALLTQIFIPTAYPEPIPEDVHQGAGTRPVIDMEPAGLARVSGLYLADGGWLMEILAEKDTLSIRASGQHDRLYPLSPTEFRHNKFNGLISFKFEDGDEKPTGLSFASSLINTEAVRVDSNPFGSDVIADLAGTYYSDEIDSFFEIKADGEDLVIENRWRGSADVVRIDDKTFGSTLYPKMMPVRNESGELTGLRVASGKIYSLLFRKVTAQ